MHIYQPQNAPGCRLSTHVCTEIVCNYSGVSVLYSIYYIDGLMNSMHILQSSVSTSCVYQSLSDRDSNVCSSQVLREAEF